MKTHTYTVSGRPRARFPVDMLRYDHCWPATEADSTIINETHDYQWRAKNEGLRPVITLTGIQPPTVGRWESFGWRVHA